MTTFEFVAISLGMLADAVTIGAAASAAVAIVWNRKKLSRLIRSLTFVRVYHGMGRIERLLSRLDKLNYGDAQHRLEIRELLHEIQGELVAARNGLPTLKEVSSLLDDLLDSKTKSKVNQNAVRQIVGRLRATIDSLVYETAEKSGDE